MSGATIGLIGGIAGTVIGVAGGVFGTAASIRSARTPETRAFIVRLSIALWLIMGAAFAVLGLVVAHVLPLWAWWIAFVVMMALLGPVIAVSNRRLAALESRAQEQPARVVSSGPAD